jgi:hypothetical protein
LLAGSRELLRFHALDCRLDLAGAGSRERFRCQGGGVGGRGSGSLHRFCCGHRRRHGFGGGCGRLARLLLARGAACLLVLLLLLDACLSRLEAPARVPGLLLLLASLADRTLGGAVVLHQRDAAGADPGAGAALDAVEQVVLLEVCVILGLCVPEQLLRQQRDGADLGAHRAADAGLCRRRRRQFRGTRRQHAVGGLHHRQLGMRQREAHHRPAHHEARGALGVKTRGLQ